MRKPTSRTKLIIKLTYLELELKIEGRLKEISIDFSELNKIAS